MRSALREPLAAEVSELAREGGESPPSTNNSSATYIRCDAFIAAHVYGASQLGILRIFYADYAIKKVRIILRKCKVSFMKLIHVISLLLVVLGGLHIALSGLGINLLAALK